MRMKLMVMAVVMVVVMTVVVMMAVTVVTAVGKTVSIIVWHSIQLQSKWGCLKKQEERIPVYAGPMHRVTQTISRKRPTDLFFRFFAVKTTQFMLQMNIL